MKFFRDYLIPRLIQYIVVIFCGITAVFFIPRMTGQDPVLEIIAQIQSHGTQLDPTAVNSLMVTLKELYGLEGTLFEQYMNMWRRVFTLDFGLVERFYDEHEKSEIVFLSFGNVHLELLAPDQLKEVKFSPNFHIAFTASNVDQVYKSLQSQGVQFSLPPTESQGCRYAYFSGPEGELLEIIQQV